jgi:hypothetical protein
MLKTKQKVRKQISDLKMDVEIVNPIESKTIMGGDWYDHDLGWLNITITGGGGGTDFGTFWGNYNDGSTWGNQGGDYYGNGGGSGPGDGSLPNHPEHICAQLPQARTCATMALSYAANYLGATGLTSSDFAEMVGKDYLSMFTGMPNSNGIVEEGLNGSQIATIMSTIFQSTTIDGSFNSIISNLNSGHPILATIDQGGGIGHEVVIVEVDANAGILTYMDSLTGGPVKSSVNAISFTGSLYSVSGVQNNSIVNQYKHDTNDFKCSICGH